MAMTYGVNNKSPASTSPPHLPTPTTFSSGLYVVLQTFLFFFCHLYVFHTAFFHSSAVMKLRIDNLSFPLLPIWPLIKSCDITKKLMD